VLRHLFGLADVGLVDGALGATATRTSAGAISTYLDDIAPHLDADGNGELEPLTDGLLIVRYLSGLTGPALVEGTLGAGATRTTGAAVAAYLQPLVP
jgi:hypothetical protein